MKLTQQQYFDSESPSVSNLVEISRTCLAKYQFRDRDEFKQSLGLIAHDAILTEDLFNAKYVRGINPSEIDGILVTDTDLKRWLTDQSRKGHSQMKKDQLIEFILETCRVSEMKEPPILQRIEQQLALDNTGKEIIKASDYDAVKLMRDVLGANGFYDLLNNGDFNFLFETELDGLSIKFKLDYCDDNKIIDYITTTDANPEKFFNDCKRLGYFMKQALFHDAYYVLTGKNPDTFILAQETKSPHIAIMYQLNEAHLEHGRREYKKVIADFKHAISTDNWLIYGTGETVQELPTPDWFIRSLEN